MGADRHHLGSAMGAWKIKTGRVNILATVRKTHRNVRLVGTLVIGRIGRFECEIEE